MRRLPRTVWALGVVSLLTDLASDMVYPVLPAFLVGTLGASALALGAIEGVAEASAAFFKLLSGRLSDLRGRRRPWVLAGYGLSGLVKPLLALALTPWHVLAVRFTDRAGKGIRSAPRDALLAEHAEGIGRGRVFGLHRSMDTVGAVLGPAVAALVLFLAPGEYRLLFGLTLVPGLLAVGVVLLVVRDRRQAGQAPGHASPDSPPAEGAGKGFAALLRPDFIAILVVTLVFSIGNSSDAFLLLRAGDLGVPTVQLPLLWLVLNVVYAGTAWWAGAWSDRVGRRWVLALGFALYAGVYLTLARASGAGVAWVAFASYGLYLGLTDGVLRAAVADRVDAGARGAAFGVFHSLTGVTLLGASLLAGWLWESVNPSAPFLLGAGCAGLAAVLSLVLLREDPYLEGEGP